MLAAVRLHRRIALPAAVTALCAISGTPAAAQSQPALTPVGTDFQSPVHVTAPPGDQRRLMVVEQGGTVRVVRDGAKLATPFFTLSDDFLNGGERGLLSIAFAPDYAASGLLYAYYTDGEGDIRVDEMRRAADSADRVETGYRRLVIEVPHTEAGNHNGGQVKFGPDGHLYLATGDGGNGYDTPFRDARDLSSLLGKVLRIDPVPGGGYTVPADNPYVGTETPGPEQRDEIWSYGLRNPFRFSFDRLTGDLFIGDVGQNTVEEINFAPSTPGGAGRGLNFGWDDCEGSFQAEPSPTGVAPCQLTGDTRAVIEQLRPASGFCSITGGYVVRDPGLEALHGRYLYGDLCYPSLRSFGASARAGDRAETALAVNSLVSLGEDACGRMHTVELGGRVSRIEDSTPTGCGPSGAGTGGPPAAGRPLGISVAAGRAQQGLRRGGVLVRVRCDQACGIRALGRLSLRREGRPRRLRQAVRRLASAGSVRVKLRLTRNGRAAVRRALRRGRRVRAAVTVRARGADRVLRVRRLRVRLVR